MAVQHPYISATGAIRQAIVKLRSTIPSKLDSATIQKLGLAPNNESYLINIFKFIKIIDEKGEFLKDARSVLTSHKDSDFADGFSKIVLASYQELFDLHGEAGWSLGSDELVNFFRKSDQSSDVVGSRQAKTFETLANISGKRDLDDSVGVQKTPARGRKRDRPLHRVSRLSERISQKQDTVVHGADSGRENPVGLTVRLELNLPANGSKEDYDNIFKSIRENLLNG